MIYFIAPLPQPLTGFSLVNSIMLQLLSNRVSVNKIDRGAPHFFVGSIFGPILRSLWSLSRIPGYLLNIAFNRVSAVYVGFSGGLAGCIDCLFIVIAKIFHVDVVIHHHSFAYVNSPTFVSNFLFLITRDSCHIVLCDEMARKVSLVYHVPFVSMHVLSNAFFAKKSSISDVTFSRDGKRFQIGFLSNITRSKGIFLFFDLARMCLNDLPNIKFVIAGPLDQDISDEFNEALSGLGNVNYIGPVYGADKADFYNAIDILTFPTCYHNEAEPVTILEAFNSGAFVVAINRGCIGGMIEEGNGLLIQPDDSFPESAYEFICGFYRNDKFFEEFSSKPKALFDINYRDSEGSLELILSKICSE